MGYITCYRLEVLTAKDEEEKDKIFEELRLQDDEIDYLLNDSCIKWYGYQDSMIEASKLFPEHIFELEGQGEEHYDTWSCRYKNGEYECIEPEIVWPTFEKITNAFIVNTYNEQIQEQTERAIQVETGGDSSGAIV